ncbi:hypothetical protein [Actinomadura terrae]|uniref:hypothetical protein n=1 Tax=Actinomadura terrae TaxID=604353 RepID=UPI001FA75E04|nr:hypothetical protein [Actinomadura terrae]
MPLPRKYCAAEDHAAGVVRHLVELAVQPVDHPRLDRAAVRTGRHVASLPPLGLDLRQVLAQLVEGVRTGN